MLKEGERLDSLQRNGYSIIQNEDGFCFGMDAVLLSAFTVVKKGERVLDLGTGTGVIPILLEAKTEGSHFTGLDIQEQCADMARRSVMHNGLQDKIDIVCGDLCNIKEFFKRGDFDVVVSNPPYMAELTGEVNPESAKAVSRHEIKCTLKDVVKAASDMLQEGGRFYMVHRPHRLAEIITVLRENRLEPKRMRMVHPRIGSDANMVLIEAVRDGGTFLKVEKPLVIFDGDGEYCREVSDIYG
ncbi:MAG: tRNA1(Val) (adenine(37)-N6)-methyltransferase [Lachnospiraceae bacterium]|nr:tRNA1(Val) (adenine(37)-N6)-methyltransferase [Lachnospiraceae bacterium]